MLPRASLLSSSRALRIELAVLGAVLLVVASLYLVDARPGGPFNAVRVTSVTWSWGDRVLTTTDGFVAAPGGQATIGLTIQNGVFFPFWFSSATTNTTGFAVASSELPTIAPGAEGNLSVTLSMPTSAWSGPLMLEINS